MIYIYTFYTICAFKDIYAFLCLGAKKNFGVTGLLFVRVKQKNARMHEYMYTFTETFMHEKISVIHMHANKRTYVPDDLYIFIRGCFSEE